MLKGMALTPPIIGRISIGKVVEKNGKRLPEKDDEFTLTSQVQNKDGWVPHPLNETLRQANTKLRQIPVRLLFDDPDLNMRASYSLFDRKTGRPLCVGNGETCRRSTASGIQSMPCPTPEGCELAEKGCKPFGRLNVRIGDDDELSAFVFRTTGFNSIRTLSTRLRYFHSVSGGLLSTLPLELRLRGKSTTQSHRAPIYYVDLTLRSGITMLDGIAQARADWDARKASGFDQVALDATAKQSLGEGVFEESTEDSVDIVEEFYPEADTQPSNQEQEPPSMTPRRSSGGLAGKLASKLEGSAMSGP